METESVPPWSSAVGGVVPFGPAPAQPVRQVGLVADEVLAQGASRVVLTSGADPHLNGGVPDVHRVPPGAGLQPVDEPPNA